MLESLNFTQGQRKGSLARYNGIEWEVVPLGTSGQVLTFGSDGLPAWADHTATDPPSVSGGLVSETYIVQTADVTRNNTDVLAATGVTLIVPVTAAGLYLMEWHLFLDSGGSAAADFKCDFNGGTFPAGGSLEGVWVHEDAAGSLVHSVIAAHTTVLDAALSSAADHHPLPVIYTTYLAGGTAGNVTLEWAQNTATVVDTKLLQGSFVRVLKVKS